MPVVRRWWAWTWSWLKWPGAAVAVTVLLAVVWGSAIEPRLTDEVRVSANLPGLPEEWAGARSPSLPT